MSYPILTCYSGGAAAAAGGVVLGVGDADNPHYQLQLQILGLGPKLKLVPYYT